MRKVRLKTAEQEARAMAQRRANARAKKRGEPLPYPNPWDKWDPTKVGPDATPEEIHQRFLEFQKLCQAPRRRTYTI